MTKPDRIANTFLQRGGAWVVAQFLLMSAVLVTAVATRQHDLPTLTMAAGLAGILAGGGFGLAGVVALGRNRTVFPQPLAGAGLIQDGIYARVRHPLYTSVMLISVGWALAWGSGWAGLLVLLEIPLFHGKARREERALRLLFPEYESYARRVPRFFPRLG